MFGIIETIFFSPLSTPWVLLGPWFSVYPTCEYHSDHGFPKSTAIAAIPPMASIQQERVYLQLQINIRTIIVYYGKIAMHIM